MKLRLALLSLLTLASAVHGQTGEAWKKLDFLLGQWVGMAGEKDTQIGAGEGSFSFEAELNHKIIVRHNSARYTSGVEHGDLMVIYMEDSMPRAIYFDSEGHVIRYAVAFPTVNRVIFESEASQAGPKYRLSYWLEGKSLNGKFEIAARSSEYKVYLSWTSKRQ